MCDPSGTALAPIALTCGTLAVLIAAYAVTSMPLVYLRWGVVAVVLYAAVVLLRSALRPAAATNAVSVASS
jgi:hypothetical protein